MKSRKLYIVVAALLFAATLPSRALAQSQKSNDEAQQLRKLVEQMQQTQMSKMQEEIDQLKGMKPETPPSQPTRRSCRPLHRNRRPPPKLHNRRSRAPPPEHVGADTASLSEFPRTRLQRTRSIMSAGPEVSMDFFGCPERRTS